MSYSLCSSYKSIKPEPQGAVTGCPVHTLIVCTFPFSTPVQNVEQKTEVLFSIIWEYTIGTNFSKGSSLSLCFQDLAYQIWILRLLKYSGLGMVHRYINFKAKRCSYAHFPRKLPQFYVGFVLLFWFVFFFLVTMGTGRLGGRKPPAEGEEPADSTTHCNLADVT